MLQVILNYMAKKKEEIVAPVTEAVVETAPATVVVTPRNGGGTDTVYL